MTTQQEYDDFKEDNKKRIDEMISEVQDLLLDFKSELEELGLDEDNSQQIAEGIFENPFNPDF